MWRGRSRRKDRKSCERDSEREVKRGRDKAREIHATRRERQRAREVKQYYCIGK